MKYLIININININTLFWCELRKKNTYIIKKRDINNNNNNKKGSYIYIKRYY